MTHSQAGAMVTLLRSMQNSRRLCSVAFQIQAGIWFVDYLVVDFS